MIRDKLAVLVVDDSAVVRQLMTTVLSQSGDIEVVTASDPIIAQRKIGQRRPDVIVLDLEMPRMDGMTFLRKLMAEDPIPVVVCSGHAGRGTETAFQALREGAVDILTKPTIGLRDFLFESAVLLADTVRAAAQARVQRRSTRRALQATETAVFAARASAHRQAIELVAVGASTGGPEALETLLTALPPDAPGLVIVQHMPAPFTAAFARRLNQCCALEIREAADGDRVDRGLALIAPGSHHMVLRQDARGFLVRLEDGPLVSRHRPSVDVLFRSAAKAAGPRAAGIILTGMGRDGADGLLEMKQSGARTIAQNEATSVVFGMPREAIASGAAGAVAGLHELPLILLGLAGPSKSASSGQIPDAAGL
jgi:two-component system chemotaxis response regulator CheB